MDSGFWKTKVGNVLKLVIVRPVGKANYLATYVAGDYWTKCTE